MGKDDAGAEARLHHLPREKTTLDTLDLFARLDDGGGRIDRGRIDAVLGRYRSSLHDSLASPSRLHGWRVQAMFEATVAALGSVRLLKTEDAGDCWFHGDDDRAVKVPDFRIVTENGHRWLVEVKNCFQKSPTDDFRMTERELRRISTYAAIEATADVKLAVYWARWQLWSLVDADALSVRGTSAHLAMKDALMGNRMSEVGDCSIGVRAPITLDLIAQDPKPVADGDEVSFTIGAVEVRCAGELLKRADERRLATNLMMYGGWGGEEEALIVGDQVTGVRWTAAPEAEMLTATQGFDLVGSLSSIYSRMFDSMTLGNSGVERIRIDVEPGALASLIPSDYQSDAMPIWRFVQVQGDETNR